jgi:hypothetical protein
MGWGDILMWAKLIDWVLHKLFGRFMEGFNPNDTHDPY